MRHLLFVLFLLFVVGCKGKTPTDQPHKNGVDLEEEVNAGNVRELASEYFKPAEGPYFIEIDGKVKDGIYTPLDLDPIEEKGRNAWMLWTGGNERFWDWLSHNGYGSMDFLKVLSLPRAERFDRAGLINEPGMRSPTPEETEASYGVVYDRPVSKYGDDYFQPDPDVYGYPTGIVGMRIFKNPEFHGAAITRWQAKQDGTTHLFYSDDEYASDPNTIKPYIVGVSCAICHASFHPLNPPTDTAEPEWANISSTIGAQYMRVREVFGNTLKEENFVYHVLDSQLPGTIDTSLIATDNINNSNTMNAIFGLGARVDRSLYNSQETMSEATFRPNADGETTPGLWDPSMPFNVGNEHTYYPPGHEKNYEKFEGNPRNVPRVLVDGSDSVGTWLALARVYLNIGTYHQQWQRTHNTVVGFKKQSPLTLSDCESNSVYWHATRNRVDSITKYFLESSAPMKLKDAIVNNDSVEKFPGMPEGFNGIPSDVALAPGRAVFAKGCIACHSSKQPDHLSLKSVTHQAKPLDMNDLEKLVKFGELPEDYAAWAKEVVELPEFWEDNYLSTDQRIPVTLTGTNSARAMATNALTGHVWEDFASNTF
jgi:cytochrome c5